MKSSLDKGVWKLLKLPPCDTVKKELSPRAAVRSFVKGGGGSGSGGGGGGCGGGVGCGVGGFGGGDGGTIGFNYVRELLNIISLFVRFFCCCLKLRMKVDLRLQLNFSCFQLVKLV